jgi:hypothetical protein
MQLARNPRFNVFAGVAADNINQPDISLLRAIGQPFQLPMRITAHGGAQIPVADRFDIIPSFWTFIQSPHMEFTIGTDVKLLFEPKYAFGNAIYFGAYMRTVGGDANFGDGAINPESIIFKLRFDYELDKHKFNFGASYDVNVSELSIASENRGAMEFSLIYMGRIQTRERNNLPCPRF